MSEKYLKEDKDLLEQLEKVGTFENEAEKKKGEVQEVLIHSILRSRKSASDTDKSNHKLTIILGVVAILQLLIAFYQFLLQTLDSKNIWVGVFFVFIIMGFIVYLMYKKVF